MLDKQQLKASLLHQLEALHQAREELLLEAQVDHVERRDEWNRLDDALRFARDEINRLGDDSQQVLSEVEVASRELLKQVQSQLEHMRARC